VHVGSIGHAEESVDHRLGLVHVGSILHTEARSCAGAHTSQLTRVARSVSGLADLDDRLMSPSPCRYDP
jgi:hypothetical protein